MSYMFHGLSSSAELTCLSRWWWEQKPLTVKQKILLNKVMCGNWMKRRWPFSTTLFWIIANKQEFEFYWCEFETALDPVLEGRGYKNRFRLYCIRYGKYLISVTGKDRGCSEEFHQWMFMPSPIQPSDQLAQNLFISLFVKLKYLRLVHPFWPLCHSILQGWMRRLLWKGSKCKSNSES